MGNYTYKACVIGDLSLRQKMMATRLLRESKSPMIMMDEYNAKTQKLIEKAEFLIVFDVGTNALEDDEFVDRMIEMGWSESRILVEGDNFLPNTVPIFK